jgi:chromosome segregation ATPase
MSKAQRQGMEEQPPQGNEYIDPPDPNERLKQLTHELKEHTHRIAQLTNESNALQTDINELDATVKQVEATVTDYGAGLADLHQRLHALHYFYDQKNKMTLAAIGERRGPIDDIIRNFDFEVTRMEERLRELGELKDAAQRESNEAAEIQALRQKQYDAANDIQKTLTKTLSELESLRADITRADDKTDVATMYFLMLEFHREMSETRIIAQQQLHLELRQRLGELELAKESARMKSGVLSAAQADYTNFDTALQAKKAGRRATLLAHVQKMNPIPAASAIPGATPFPESATGSESSGGGSAPSAPAAPTPAPVTPVAPAGIATSTPSTSQKK